MSRNSTCFGQFVCPSSGVYSLDMVYVRQVCRQLSSSSICSCSKVVYKLFWHIPLLNVQWINSWWWTEELSETCRVSWQYKFVKLVHLVGFITKKSVTVPGHMNVKYCQLFKQKDYEIIWYVTYTGKRQRMQNINK